MKVDLNKVLINLMSKEPLRIQVGKDMVEATALLVSAELLLSVFSDETIEPSVKIQRARLAEKILSNDHELSLEELLLIKSLSDKYSPPGVAMQMEDILEVK